MAPERDGAVSLNWRSLEIGNSFRIQGAVEFTPRSKGDPIEVGPGQLFILAPGTSHDPVKLQTASIWVFIFNLQVLDAQGWGGSVFASCGQALGAAHSLLRAVHAEEKQHLVFNIPAVERLGISNLLKRIKEENAEKHTGWEEMVNSFLNLLLIDLMRRLLKNPFLKVLQPHPVVAHAMDFIDLNFRNPILLRDIAGHADPFGVFGIDH